MTDLRRYRRERERAQRAPRKPAAREPILGRRKGAGLILFLTIAVLAALALLQRH